MERSFLIHCGLYSKNFAAPQNKKQSGVQFCRSVADMVKGGVVVFVYSDENSEVRAWAAPPMALSVSGPLTHNPTHNRKLLDGDNGAVRKQMLLISEYKPSNGAENGR